MSTQSGALGLAILDYAKKLNIGISTFVSVGNKADVSGNDLLQYWDDDPRTDGDPALPRELRKSRQVRRRSPAASRASKPIVAVKSGRSAAGARAASSHTGALADPDARRRRAVSPVGRHPHRHARGALRRRDAARAPAGPAGAARRHPDQRRRARHPGGRRLRRAGPGGPGALAKSAARLRSFLPAAASVGNPVDMIASAAAGALSPRRDDPAGDERLDAVLVIFIPPIVTNAEDVAAAIVDGAAGADKPVLAIFMSAARSAAGPRADSLLPVPGVRGDRAGAGRDLRRMEAARRRQGPGVRRCRREARARHRRLRPRARRRLAVTGRGRGAADRRRHSGRARPRRGLGDGGRRVRQGARFSGRPQGRRTRHPSQERGRRHPPRARGRGGRDPQPAAT